MIDGCLHIQGEEVQYSNMHALGGSEVGFLSNSRQAFGPGKTDPVQLQMYTQPSLSVCDQRVAKLMFILKNANPYQKKQDYLGGGRSWPGPSHLDIYLTRCYSHAGTSTEIYSKPFSGHLWSFYMLLLIITRSQLYRNCHYLIQCSLSETEGRQPRVVRTMLLPSHSTG